VRFWLLYSVWEQAWMKLIFYIQAAPCLRNPQTLQPPSSRESVSCPSAYATTYIFYSVHNRYHVDQTAYLQPYAHIRGFCRGLTYVLDAEKEEKARANSSNPLILVNHATHTNLASTFFLNYSASCLESASWKRGRAFLTAGSWSAYCLSR